MTPLVATLVITQDDMGITIRSSVTDGDELTIPDRLVEIAHDAVSKAIAAALDIPEPPTNIEWDTAQ